MCGYTVRVDSGIGLITFSRPDKLNAMTMATKRDLIKTLTQARVDDRVRVLVITGTGRAAFAEKRPPRFNA